MKRAPIWRPAEVHGGDIGEPGSAEGTPRERHRDLSSTPLSELLFLSVYWALGRERTGSRPVCPHYIHEIVATEWTTLNSSEMVENVTLTQLAPTAHALVSELSVI